MSLACTWRVNERLDIAVLFVFRPHRAGGAATNTLHACLSAARHKNDTVLYDNSRLQFHHECNVISPMSGTNACQTENFLLLRWFSVAYKQVSIRVTQTDYKNCRQEFLVLLWRNKSIINFSTKECCLHMGIYRILVAKYKLPGIL
jgi:hypothetical protein